MKSSKPAPSAAPYLPPNLTLPRLRSAAAACRGCHLWEKATQTVFGEGGTSLRLMLVGEQPGDQEDLSGHPFVGPAGRILNFALDKARLDRSQIYVTNAVKHFKFEPRGKRRIHKKPTTLEIRACQPWLEAEIQVLHPELIVCLGATAAQSLLGPQFRLTESRGQILASALGPKILATVHPSSLLRVPDEATRRRELEKFTQDLMRVREVLSTTSA